MTTPFRTASSALNISRTISPWLASSRRLTTAAAAKTSRMTSTGIPFPQTIARHKSLTLLPSEFSYGLVAARCFSSHSVLRNSDSTVGSSDGSNSSNNDLGERGATGGTPIAQIPKPKLQITFTCTAPTPNQSSSSNLDPSSDQNQDQDPSTMPRCGHRSTHQFTKRAYLHGVVLVQCPSCTTRHLIADHLDWFSSIKAGKDNLTGLDKSEMEPGEDGSRGTVWGRRTIEDIMREKGERVRKGFLDGQGETIEYDPDDEESGDGDMKTTITL